MADFDEVLERVRIQYPTNDPVSLQRSITQIKDLLEDEDFYNRLASSVGTVTVRVLSGGSGSAAITIYWDDVVGKPSTFPPSPHQHLEADITDLDKYTQAEADGRFARWMGEWSQQEYQPNSMVLDGAWLMISNKVTSDTAGPINQGDEHFIYAGFSPTGQVTAKSVVFAQEYTLPGDLFVMGYRIYTVLGNNYSVFVSNETTGQVDQKLTFTATATGWQEYAASGNLFLSGEVFSVGVLVTEPDPTPTVFTGDWNYITPANDTAALAGQLIHSNKTLGLMHLHQEDSNGADRTLDLDTLVAGDVIEGAGLRWSIQGISKLGAVYDVIVAPLSQGAPDGIQTFNFETVVQTPITTVIDGGYYQFDTAVRGWINIDGAGATYNDNAYGIDIKIQAAYISPDWEPMSNAGPAAGNTSQSAVTQLEGQLAAVEARLDALEGP